MAARIATSPLSGRIQMGRVNKAGNCFIGTTTDVTSDVLKAVIEKAEYHGGSFDIGDGTASWVVTVVKKPASTPPSTQPKEQA